MNDGTVRCRHGFTCDLVPAPELGEGWVRPIPSTCGICTNVDGAVLPMPFKPGERVKVAGAAP